MRIPLPTAVPTLHVTPPSALCVLLTKKHAPTSPVAPSSEMVQRKDYGTAVMYKAAYIYIIYHSLWCSAKVSHLLNNKLDSYLWFGAKVMTSF